MRKSLVFSWQIGSLLVLWCLLFMRCETTEKSMVRAIFLHQSPQGVEVGLFYQAPEAAADASDAQGEIHFVCGDGTSLKEALYTAESALPLAANYRLCDHLLLTSSAATSLTESYEKAVLEQQCGRTSAFLTIADFTPEEFSLQSEKIELLPDKLLDKLKRLSAQSPHLYQREETVLCPVLSITKDGVDAADASVLYAEGNCLPLTVPQSEIVRMLMRQGSGYALQTNLGAVQVRRAVVSVDVHTKEIELRLDCQCAYGESSPAKAQIDALGELCTQTVQVLWSQGIDVLALQARSALKWGSEAALSPTKNDCPPLRTVVCFLPV